MINKQKAKNNGIKVIDSNETLGNDKAAVIEQLKALLPNVINSDNQLNTQALADVVDIANTTSNNRGLELTFAGKGIARAKADSPTDLELKTEIAQSKNFDKTDNVVIRGDNLDVLKILYQNYHNKIKMIYIDPPYNTESENFTYNDNFKQSETELIERFGLNEDTSDFLHNVYGTRSHSGWLSFMLPRLKLAKDLLTDDGVILISIGDNEQANLKILCDEIFGEGNFVADLIWRKKAGGGNDSQDIAVEHEYILMYKRKDNGVYKIPLNEKIFASYKHEDDKLETHGKYKTKNLDDKSLGDSKGLHFDIECPDGTILKGSDNQWKCNKETFENRLKDNRIVFKETKHGYCVHYKIYLNEEKGKLNYDSRDKVTPKGRNLSSILFNTALYKDGNNDMKKLFDEEKPFNYPKPVSLLKTLILSSANDSDVILDFFAGSGTTADAVMQLNAEDGGKRKFILVQIDERIDESKNADVHKFCTDNNLEPVISSITIERLNRAGEKIKDEHTAKNGGMPNTLMPDIGYKVFSTIAKTKAAQSDDKQKELLRIVNKRASVLDTLYNMLAATCKPLNTTIECLIENALYKADEELYLIANIDNNILAKYTDRKINLDGWADIDLEQYLNLDIVNKENISIIY